MRILHSLVHYLLVSENWIYPQFFASPGAEVAILCRSLEENLTFPLGQIPAILDPPPWALGLGIPRLVNSLCFRCGYSFAIARVKVKRWRPDVIHSHFGSRGWEMIPIAKGSRASMVVSFYGSDAWALPTVPLWRERFAQLFATEARFIAEGPAMRARLIALGANPSRVEVVRIGVECQSIPYQEPVRSPDQPLKILMFGRFVEKKGFVPGLAACAQAIANGANLEVAIAGGAAKGDSAGAQIEADLRNIVETADIAERVSFLGFVPPAERFALLRNHHVFLAPSCFASNGDGEGGAPVSLTEAMASGLVPIGTDHCDIPELIKDSDTGKLVPMNDVSALAGAICEVAGWNESRLREYSLNARKLVERSFSREEQLASLRSIYSSMAGKAA